MAGHYNYIIEFNPSCICGDFLGDMWPNRDEEEPEWVKGERTQFSSYRDTNGDGFMDHEEVKNWIIPPNYDHSEAEAKHLIYEADANKVRFPSFLTSFWTH